MRKITSIFLINAAALLWGCTTVVEKPQKQWSVHVTDAQLVGNNAYSPIARDETKRVAAAPQPPSGKTWVWHADGSKQCEKAKGIEPERLAKALQSRGIQVYQYRSSHDDRMHPLICGSVTGKTVELEIRSADLGKARKMGLLEKSREN